MRKFVICVSTRFHSFQERKSRYDIFVAYFDYCALQYRTLTTRWRFWRPKNHGARCCQWIPRCSIFILTLNWCGRFGAKKIVVIAVPVDTNTHEIHENRGQITDRFWQFKKVAVVTLGDRSLDTWPKIIAVDRFWNSRNRDDLCVVGYLGLWQSKKIAVYTTDFVTLNRDQGLLTSQENRGDCCPAIRKSWWFAQGLRPKGMWLFNSRFGNFINGPSSSSNMMMHESTCGGISIWIFVRRSFDIK